MTTHHVCIKQQIDGDVVTHESSCIRIAVYPCAQRLRSQFSCKGIADVTHQQHQIWIENNNAAGQKPKKKPRVPNKNEKVDSLSRPLVAIKYDSVRRSDAFKPLSKKLLLV